MEEMQTHTRRQKKQKWVCAEEEKIHTEGRKGENRDVRRRENTYRKLEKE